jgi:hypothetical protein
MGQGGAQTRERVGGAFCACACSCFFVLWRFRVCRAVMYRPVKLVTDKKKQAQVNPPRHFFSPDTHCTEAHSKEEQRGINYCIVLYCIVLYFPRLSQHALFYINVITMDETKLAPGVPRGVWGPIVWDHLYVLILANSDRDISAAAWVNYFQVLGDMLPCAECRDHFRDRVAALRTQLPGAGTSFADGALALWLSETHNEVNIRLNKPRGVWSASEAQEAFQRRVVGRVLAASTDKEPLQLHVCTEGPAPAACGCATPASG